MDAAHAEAPSHFFPQQLAALVPNDAVQHATGLLGIDQLHIDLPGRLERTFDGRLGDFVEEHAEHFSIVPSRLAVDLFGDMPRNRFALAVRVRGKEHRVGFLRPLFNLGEDFGFALDDHVLRLEVMLEVDAQLAGGEILHVADGGQNRVAAAQIPGDRSGFGWGLHNDQRFRHSHSCVSSEAGAQKGAVTYPDAGMLFKPSYYIRL